MLCNINDLYGFSVAATDGLIGEIKNCYFDDASWTVRFFVVETGVWLGGRKVLISPNAIVHLDRTERALSASMTLDRVKLSPDIDTTKPVSRQHEVEQFGYYGYPFYWGEGQIWGARPQPGMRLEGSSKVLLHSEPQAVANLAAAQQRLHLERGDDPHLRSGRAIERYHLQATDGEIGHVESMLLDDEAWFIRYLVVNTSDWWLGHQTLVAPAWIADISWLNATVSVDLTRQAIKDAPPFDSKTLPNLDQERALFAHYGRTDFRNSDAPGRPTA